MGISFNQVPSNLRIPFTSIEFDNSRANQGPALLAYAGLIIGQKLPSGSQAADSIARVTNADQVAALCGRGSIIHRMAQAWFAASKSTETWIGVLADAGAAALATGSLTVTGPATAAGSIALYLGGRRVVVGVASGDSANTIAGNIASAIGKHAAGTVTFASPVAGTNVTIAGVQFVGTVGAVVPGAATYSVDTDNASAAASLRAQVNAHEVASKSVRASNLAAVVTLRAVDSGAVGNAIALATTDVVKAAISGATLTGATTDVSDLGVHASVAGAVVTLYAQNAGAVMNEFDVRHSYQDGEALPAGVGLTVGAMSGGVTNPVMTGLIAALGEKWFNVIANSCTDATSLTALETELVSRFGPMRMIDGVMISGKNDSYSNVAAFGLTRNCPHSIMLRLVGDSCLTPPTEFAAHVASTVALSASIDPARPFQTLPLPYVVPPKDSDQDTNDERNLLLFDGIATTKVVAGLAQIDRLITTYRVNATGSPDESYLAAETMFTLMYLRYSFRVRWSKYSRHKLSSDGAPIPPGQAIMTPKLARAEAIAWFIEMQDDLGLVEGLEQFVADLVVERNATNKNRLDFKLSPDLINQLVTTGVQLQFLR